MNQRQVPISQLRLKVSDMIDNLKNEVKNGFVQWEQRANGHAIAVQFIKDKGLFEEFKKYAEALAKGEATKLTPAKKKPNAAAIKKARQKTRTQKKR